MKRVWISVLLIFVGAQIAVAQKALILGNITDPTTKLVKVDYLTNLLDGSSISFEVDVDATGGYIFLLPIDQPTIVNLYYDNDNIKLFLKPGNQLHFNFHSEDFKEKIVFGGDGKEDNEILYDYRKTFDQLSSSTRRIFMTEYPIAADILEQMRQLGPYQFTEYAKKNKQEELDFYLQSLEKGPSQEFNNYLNRHIEYKWTIYRMMYPNYHQNLVLNENYYDFVKEVDIMSEDALSSKDYISFLDKFMDFVYHEAIREQGLQEVYYFDEKYNLVKTFFDGELRDYALARLLITKVNRSNYEKIKPLFDDYMATSTSDFPKATISRVLGELTQFSTGTTAPDFQLTDRDGNSVRLSDYRGKMVYLSFWASWCKPCIEEIHRSKENKGALYGENIEFVYVSIDKSESSWQKAMTSNGMTGVQMWAGPTRGSKVEKDYQIVSLPVYFLLKEDGTYIMDFPKAGDPGFSNFIRNNIGL